MAAFLHSRRIAATSHLQFRAVVAERESDSHRKASRLIYEARINAAMDYVESNLSSKISLDLMASAAAFSPFHFHRVFTAVVGETPTSHVRRVRLERSAVMLIDRPTQSVSAISADCGYGTPSAFARSFKARFGTTPKEWRDGNYAARGKPLRPRLDLDRVEVPATGHRSWTLSTDELGEVPITVTEIDELPLVYLRHAGPFAGSEVLFERLFDRLEEAMESSSVEATSPARYAVYHDDPAMTDEHRLRVSVAAPTSRDLRPAPPLGALRVGSGLYAVACFKLAPDSYRKAWDALLSGWLPVSGFEPSLGHYLERFPESTLRDPALRDVEICIPVQRLRI